MQTVLTYPHIANSFLNNGEIMEDRLLTVSQAADWLHMKPATVQRMAREGRVPAAKIGRTYRFRKADLEEWFNQQKNTNGTSQSQ